MLQMCLSSVCLSVGTGCIVDKRWCEIGLIVKNN